MLGMFRLSRSKEEKARHAQFSHNISELIVLRESHRDALAVPLDPPKGRTMVPGKRATAFADDVDSANPAIGELSTDETRA
jgi:hypothetical protein